MAIKLKQIEGGVQLKTDIDGLKGKMPALEALPGKISALEGKVNTLETETMPAAIETAKGEAITQANSHAETKANEAKQAAIADAQGKIDTAKEELNASITQAKQEASQAVTQAKDELTQKINGVDSKVEGKQNKITADTDLAARDLVLNGNLTVKGVTTVVESENVAIKDQLIELNSEKSEAANGVGLKAYTGNEDEAYGLVFKNGKWNTAKVTAAPAMSLLNLLQEGDSDAESEEPVATTEVLEEVKPLATEEFVNTAVRPVSEKVNQVEGNLNTHTGNNDIHVNAEFKQKVNTAVEGLETVKEQVSTIQGSVSDVTGRVETVEGQIPGLQSGIQSANEAISGVQESVSGIQSAVEQIKATVEFEEEVEDASAPIVLSYKPEDGTTMVFVNGVRYRKGFTVDGKNLTWEVGFALEAADEVSLRYVVAADQSEETEEESGEMEG